MEAVSFIINAFLYIFSGNDSLIKNIGFFSLSGLVAFVLFNFYQYYSNHASNISTTVIFFAVVLAIIISAYTWGYCLQFMHNVHNNKELPYIDGKPIVAFFRAVPLNFFWAFIFGISGVVFSLVPFINVLFVSVFLPFFSTFLYPFINVIYSKDFDATGLFNVMVPFQFISAFVPLFVVNICTYILIFLAAGSLIIIGLIFHNNTEFFTYIALTLLVYYSFIIQLIVQYCFVQIYKERFEEEY